MANISVLGIERETLSRLKELAKTENISVNALVLRLLERDAEVTAVQPPLSRHDKLN